MLCKRINDCSSVINRKLIIQVYLEYHEFQLTMSSCQLLEFSVAAMWILDWKEQEKYPET